MKRLLIEVFTAMSLIAAIGACGGETRGRSAVSSESSAADDVAGGSPVFAPANIDEPPPPTVTYAGQATTTTTPRHAPSVTSPAAPPSSTSTSTLPMDTTTTVTTSTTVAPVTTAVDECASITLQADALFRSESAVIDPTAETALLARIAPLIECMQPGDRLRLDAWTDDRGGALDNLEL
jgi:outer membrane protein OmpA-like peptidoglycan-associated protein